jgi:hypothetical protein
MTRTFFSDFFGVWKHKKIEISPWVHVLNEQQKFWCRLVQPIKTESIVQGSNADRAYKTRSESKRIEHEPKKVSITEG